MRASHPSLRIDSGFDLVPVCQERGWKAQFACPSGWLGGLVGRLMAFRNAPMNAVVVDALDPCPDERIVEIGFGPGVALEMAAARVGNGLLAGVDVSRLMVERARRRLHRHLSPGCVDLRTGSASALPFPDRCFHRAFAVNSLHHWPSPARGLAELRRVLVPGGVLVLGLRRERATAKHLVAPGYDKKGLERVESAVRAVGFSDLRRVEHDVGHRVVCLTARA